MPGSAKALDLIRQVAERRKRTRAHQRSLKKMEGLDFLMHPRMPKGSSLLESRDEEAPSDTLDDLGEKVDSKKDESPIAIQTTQRPATKPLGAIVSLDIPRSQPPASKPPTKEPELVAPKKEAAPNHYGRSGYKTLATEDERLEALSAAYVELQKKGKKITIALLAESAAVAMMLKPDSAKMYIQNKLNVEQRKALGIITRKPRAKKPV